MKSLSALLSLAALCALIVPAFAQDAASLRWTFDGPKAPLTQLSPAWASDLDQTSTTGRGVLRIRRGLDTPPNAFIALPAEMADRPLWLLVRLSEWSLNGKSNEVIRLGFSSNDDAKSPSVVAQLKLERQEAVFQVSAESFPNTLTGSTTTPQPAGKSIAGGKLAVLLQLDPQTDTYRASIKTVQMKTWQPLGEGRISKTRVPRFLRLGLSGPFNTNSSEKVDIDEIVVSTSDPTTP